jgi:hypothetical protein
LDFEFKKDYSGNQELGSLGISVERGPTTANPIEPGINASVIFLN